MAFLKDLFAIVALGSFGAATLAWADVLSRLV
jgi:hypothetical protein